MYADSEQYYIPVIRYIVTLVYVIFLDKKTQLVSNVKKNRKNRKCIRLNSYL